MLLVGSGPEEVRTGLDVLAGEAPGLASAASFVTAFGRVPEERLAAGYADLAAGYADLAALRPLLGAAPVSGDSSSSEALAGLLDALPLDLTSYLAARPDGAIYEAFVTPAPGTPAISVGEPALAASFPLGTQLLVEVPDLGGRNSSAASWMAGLVDAPDQDAVDVLASSVEKLAGWVGDAAVGAGMEGSRLWFGLVIEGAEDGAADVYVGALQAGLAAAVLERSSDSWGPEAPFSVRTMEVDGVEVTTVSFVPEVTAFSFPIEPSIDTAQDGDRLIIGTSGFVALSLELDPEASLASDGRYSEALTEAGSPNAGHVYVDIGGAREALDPVLAFTAPEYAEIAPWVEPFDRATLGIGVTDEGVMTMTLLLQSR